MIEIDMFADLSCPFAYLVHGYWRQIRDDYSDRIVIRHRSLALEYVNREPTPKQTLDVELPILFADEPELPYIPWHARDSTWPVTIWPAFEAVASAGRQSIARADDLAWAIRVAFFDGSQCISMRHVLLPLAESTGLDMQRFTEDFDSGRSRQQLLNDARDGWETLRLPGSPTWRLPSGDIVADFGLPEIEVDGHGRPHLVKPGIPRADRIALMHAILDRP